MICMGTCIRSSVSEWGSMLKYNMQPLGPMSNMFLHTRCLLTLIFLRSDVFLHPDTLHHHTNPQPPHNLLLSQQPLSKVAHRPTQLPGLMSNRLLHMWCMPIAPLLRSHVVLQYSPSQCLGYVLCSKLMELHVLVSEAQLAKPSLSVDRIPLFILLHAWY